MGFNAVLDTSSGTWRTPTQEEISQMSGQGGAEAARRLHSGEPVNILVAPVNPANASEGVRHATPQEVQAFQDQQAIKDVLGVSFSQKANETLISQMLASGELQRAAQQNSPNIVKFSPLAYNLYEQRAPEIKNILLQNEAQNAYNAAFFLPGVSLPSKKQAELGTWQIVGQDLGNLGLGVARSFYGPAHPAYTGEKPNFDPFNWQPILTGEGARKGTEAALGLSLIYEGSQVFGAVGLGSVADALGISYLTQVYGKALIQRTSKAKAEAIETTAIMGTFFSFDVARNAWRSAKENLQLRAMTSSEAAPFDYNKAFTIKEGEAPILVNDLNINAVELNSGYLKQFDIIPQRNYILERGALVQQTKLKPSFSGTSAPILIDLGGYSVGRRIEPAQDFWQLEITQRPTYKLTESAIFGFNGELLTGAKVRAPELRGIEQNNEVLVKNAGAFISSVQNVGYGTAFFQEKQLDFFKSGGLDVAKVVYPEANNFYGIQASFKPFQENINARFFPVSNEKQLTLSFEKSISAKNILSQFQERTLTEKAGDFFNLKDMYKLPPILVSEPLTASLLATTKGREINLLEVDYFNLVKEKLPSLPEYSTAARGLSREANNFIFQPFNFDTKSIDAFNFIWNTPQKPSFDLGFNIKEAQNQKEKTLPAFMLFPASAFDMQLQPAQFTAPEVATMPQIIDYPKEKPFFEFVPDIYNPQETDFLGFNLPSSQKGKYGKRRERALFPAFDVFSRRGGKEIKLNVNPLPENLAFFAGEEYNLKTLGRSFYLRPAGLTEQPDISPIVYGDLFRKPKRGSSLPPTALIQKNALSSPGEIIEIQEAKGKSLNTLNSLFKNVLGF